MVQQLFEGLFVVSLIGLAAAPVVGLVFLALPLKKIGRRVVVTSQLHARV